MPERLSVRRIQSNEVPFRVAGEDEATRRRQHTRPSWRGVSELPLDFSALRIDGSQRTDIGFGFIGWKIRTAVVRMASFIGLRGGAEDVALITRAHVEQAGLNIEARRHPVRAS